jgi:hypothetical protein
VKRGGRGGCVYIAVAVAAVATAHQPLYTERERERRSGFIRGETCREAVFLNNSKHNRKMAQKIYCHTSSKSNSKRSKI